VTDDDEDSPPPPPRSRSRSLRKFALWLMGLLGMFALVLFLGRWQVGRVGEQQLRIETSRLDTDEPGWKFDAIFAERQKSAPPPADNAATAVLGVTEGIPEDWRKWRNSEDANRWWGRRADNRFPPQDVTETARKFAADTARVREEALRLRHTRTGNFPLTVTPDPLAITLPHLDKCRQVLSLLQYDAYLAAIEKNPNRGISAARAALAVSRAIGDEPFLVSQLVRIASSVLASQTALQVIAWGEPTEGLAELQTELLAEADVPFFLYGMRGERAVLDRVFRGLADGTIPIEHWFRYADVKDPGPEHYAAFRTYRPLLPGDHAKALELSSRYVEATKLPHHEQLAALKVINIPPGPPEEFRYILTRLLIPAAEKVAEAGLRARAELLAAAAGIACERFRQKHGRWPHDPTELVPTFLPAVPVNPFTGKLIGCRTFEDRIAVYFYWADSPRKVDDLPQDFRDGNPPGAAYGYRLWNPARRGLPAEEKVIP
jgi:hypothetical protein